LSITGEKGDEEFTFARLYVSKVKSEVKSIVQHSAQLELTQTENARKMDEMDKNLSDSKLLVQQACVSENFLW
jgi:kinesin family protein 5